MTPEGTYRSELETHLHETRGHAARVGPRARALQGGLSPLTALTGLSQNLVAHTVALSKAPLDLLHGRGLAEKVLKNAKDTCATEALEIATYTVIEELARHVGDEETAELVKQIRADEERMLARVMQELPRLAVAMGDTQARAGEPWPGYDEETVADVEAHLSEADEDQFAAVREYERSHKDRVGVLRATERRLTATEEGS